jgi:hypothetical protein
VVVLSRYAGVLVLIRHGPGARAYVRVRQKEVIDPIYALYGAIPPDLSSAPSTAESVELQYPSQDPKRVR